MTRGQGWSIKTEGRKGFLGQSVDLHIHTIASEDGGWTPGEIFGVAASQGLKAIAFAEHDSVASLAQGEILGSVTGVELIPSLELSTRFERFDLHALMLPHRMEIKTLHEILAAKGFRSCED